MTLQLFSILIKKTPLLLLLFCCNTAFAQFEAHPNAQIVKTGVHLMNIYNLNINEHTFYADFYVWFKWKGDRDPMNIEFVNAVEKWGFTQTPFYAENKLLADGYYYNGMRIDGRFYHAFDLMRFPLDRHQLDMQIENTQYPIDSLIYVPDSNDGLVREHFMLPGWDIVGLSSDSKPNRYATNFGETGRNNATFCDFTFRLSIARPVNYFLLKLLLPLLIVMLVSFGAMNIHPTNIDARLSLSIGSLLATVFLQQSYSDALPDVGYMVLMDKIYLLSYCMITAIMLRMVLVGNRLAKSKEENVDIPAIRRTDTKLSLLCLLLLLVGVVVLVL